MQHALRDQGGQAVRRLAAVAGACEALQQQETHQLTASILQHIRLLSGGLVHFHHCSHGEISKEPQNQQSASGSSAPSGTGASPATGSSSSTSCNWGSIPWSKTQQNLRSPLQDSGLMQPVRAGQLQQQLPLQYRCFTAVAAPQSEDPGAPATVMQQHKLGTERSPLDNSIVLSPSVSRLSELVQQPDVDARSALLALNRLSKLNKLHRTALKHQVKALQQRWQSLRPLDAEQEQVLQDLKQQHAQHESELQDLLTQLVQKLDAEHSSLTAEQVVQVLTCLGSLGGLQRTPGGYGLLLQVLQRLTNGLGALQTRHFAQIATALAQLQEAESGAAAAADDVITDAADDSTAADSLAQQQQHEQQHEQQQAAAEASRLLVLNLCNGVQQCGPLMDATALANFVAAMGRLGHYDWQTMQLLSRLAVRQVQRFNAGQVAKTLLGFTKLRHYDADLCALLARAAERTMAEASGVHMAQVVWALAHQRYEEPGVFEAAARQIPLNVSQLQPRHVSNISWAYAVRKAYSPALYDALGQRMVQLLAADRDSSSSADSSADSSAGGSLFLDRNDCVLPHHLSLVVWSFAKQGHKHEAMMSAVADRVVQVADQMLPQNVSNTAWAFGRLGMQHPEMFAALSAVAKESKLEGYNNQNITDLAWGFAEAGNQDASLFELIASATSKTLWDLSPHSLSDLIWAFATARDPLAAKVLNDATPAVINCLQRFSVGMLADLLWAYSAVGVKHDDLLAAVAQVLPLRIPQLELDTDSQAKVIWAMQQLAWRDPVLEQHLGAIIPGLDELLGS